jgi:hypothetical protein
MLENDCNRSINCDLMLSRVPLGARAQATPRAAIRAARAQQEASEADRLFLRWRLCANLNPKLRRQMDDHRTSLQRKLGARLRA